MDIEHLIFQSYFQMVIHHGTAQYEIGDSNLTEEKNFQTDISISSFGSDSSFGLDVFYNSIQDYIYLEPTGQTMNALCQFIIILKQMLL